MTKHSYKITENVAQIFADGKQIYAQGPFETAEEADAFAKAIVERYNDPAQNPNGIVFPNSLYVEETTPETPVVE